MTLCISADGDSLAQLTPPSPPLSASSMVQLDSTRLLPVELSEKVSDFLDLQSLLVLASVSRRWRAIVHDHPTYWRDIFLDTPSLSSVLLLGLRLERGGSRPAYVSIDVQKPWPPLRAMLFPIVAAHLHRISRLSLTVTAQNANSLFRALSNPAPLLHAFELIFLRPQSALCTLPLDVFGGVAPSLTNMALINVSLTEAPYAAFAHVCHLVIGFDGLSPTTAVPFVFEIFPRIRYLSLMRAAMLEDTRFRNQDCWSALETLVVLTNIRCRDAVFQVAPVGDLVHLITQDCNREHVTLFARHLEGPLELAIEDVDEQQFNIVLRSRTPVRSRVFLERCDDWVTNAALPHDALRREHILARVVTFVMPIALWYAIIGFMAPLPALSMLIILLHGGHRLLSSRLSSRLQCPNMEVLVLRGPHDIALERSAAIRDFASNALDGTQSSHVLLRLERVHVEDGIDDLQHLFRDIQCDNAAHVPLT
ncbi:hypothetical protein EXIGLDRAFT_726248 [Exidia glandulosa HHB12029]|uniref:F-box domain-containing protein n=1 Tax=Exidia glandulosa HHB12029 TaxID=1314781 RepID=A0A165MF81_EXIGL|nr:hypothetical protein EXIGLDRAFT_726248 [Exidia glandulosa HHB12029]